MTLERIPLFDAEKVRPEVKRLAACFAIAATPSVHDRHFEAEAEDIIREGKEIYNAVTTAGPAGIGDLTADESSYLRFQFLRLAKSGLRATGAGWDDPVEKLMERAAEFEAETIKNGFRLK